MSRPLAFLSRIRLRRRTQWARLRDSNWPSPLEPGAGRHRALSSKSTKALRGLPNSKLISRPSHKPDLSLYSIRDREAREGKVLYVGGRKTSKSETKSLSEILSSYVHHIQQPHQNNEVPEIGADSKSVDLAIGQVFNAESLHSLQKKGYDVEDVISWAWILTAETASLAALRLSTITTTKLAARRPQLPVFVLLRVLNADSISADTLKLLLDNATYRAFAESESQSDTFQPRFSEQSGTIAIVRLLRHARKVSPILFSDIVSLAGVILQPQNIDGLSKKKEYLQRVCHIYNRILSLLALPTSTNPFLNVAEQQKAQFLVLRKMTEFDPQLQVTREGYRALVQVQVAHKKTEAERDWARAKGPSWPPWRKEKDGISFDTPYPGSKSRASFVLARLNNAGYSHTDWEQRAQIFAGWDTDNSPTIQKRQWLPRETLRSLGALLHKAGHREAEIDHNVWAARISATRSLREAWACFCSYDRLCGTENRERGPYHAMFEKLFARVHMAESNPPSEVLPGDAREVFSDMISSRDLVWIPRNVPSIGALYTEMIEKNVKPAGQLLIDLIDNAESPSTGFKYVQDSLFNEVKKDVLLHAEKYSTTYLLEVLPSFPPRFLAAFVRLLLRPGMDWNDIQMYRPSSMTRVDPLTPPMWISPTAYALELVELFRPKYLPIWNAFFDSFRQQIAQPQIPNVHLQTVLRTWVQMKSILELMRGLMILPDYGTWDSIGVLLENVILHSFSLKRVKTWESHRVDDYSAAAVNVAKKLFGEIVAGKPLHSSELWLPDMSSSTVWTAPMPRHLHSLVRVLGSAGDLEGIRDVIAWMKSFDDQLKAVRSELASGPTMHRRILTAASVFFEGSWMTDDILARSHHNKMEECHRVVRDIVASQPNWGGWPSDDEVEEYLESQGRWVSRLRRLENQKRSESDSIVKTALAKGHCMSK